ncbi:hypothetical protein G6F65_022349 [Rhizopus arrhizus]|nr:hypothetical protein G6F65_022349 [Rhizopus arrhizus]
MPWSRQHGQGVALPAHLGLRVDARKPVDAALKRAAPGGQPGLPVFHGDADVAPEQGRDRKQDCQGDQQVHEQQGGGQAADPIEPVHDGSPVDRASQKRSRATVSPAMTAKTAI